MRRTARLVLLVAFALAVHTRAIGAGDAVVLRAGVPDRIFARDCLPFRVRLELVNLGSRSIYVSPVIGQMFGTLRILARRAGSQDQPQILYDYGVSDPSWTFQDLLELRRHRRLELSLAVNYKASLGTQGDIEVWAEYDARRMVEVDKRAFAGSLRSAPAVGRLESEVVNPGPESRDQ